MKTSNQVLSGLAAGLLLCGGVTLVRAAGHAFALTAITSGNWNSVGIHDPTTLYQIGYSFQRTNEQIAYFEFNLTPAQGLTYTNANILIPGSTDYSINSYWANPDNHDGPGGSNTNHIQFKVGIRPLCNTNYPETLNEILTGNNNSSLYVNVEDANRNQDLGYGWVPDGFHFGERFDLSTYNTYRFQNALNAGGNYILWAADDVDTVSNGSYAAENYIWGSTSYSTNIILYINTSN